MTGSAVDGESSAAVSCDAKIDGMQTSSSWIDFAGVVRSANLDHVALLQALLEDPEVRSAVTFLSARRFCFSIGNAHVCGSSTFAS